MGRPRSTTPKYRCHISGQAVVTFDGKDFYLGKHGTPESTAKYHRLVAEYQENGFIADDQQQHQEDQPITVADVTADYREHIKTKYANSKDRRRNLEVLCDALDAQYGKLPADEFGPRRLSAIRQTFVDAGNARTTVNQKVADIKRIFRCAVSTELIDLDVHTRLGTLEPLQYGQSEAAEAKPVKPVKVDDVRATIELLSPVLQAMVRLHIGCGMRPSEVFKMRPCDIDRSNPNCWLYRPGKHKTTRKGKSREIPIVGDLRIVLGPFLNRDPNSFCFSPAESFAWVQEQKRLTRQSKVQPSQIDRSKAKPKHQPGDQWNKDSYRRAIQRAAKRAKVARWNPIQIRHTSATFVRHALGIEHAQQLLGHSHLSTTEIYAEGNQAKAIEAARHTPTL